MSTTATLKPANQLWGIYQTGRECARVSDDPLRPVVQASLKLAPGEVALRPRFSDPLGTCDHARNNAAGTVASQTAAKPMGEISPRTFMQHPHLIMQIPTSTEIRTTIQVLKKFGEHININAANEVIGLHESPQSDLQAARIGRRMIDQITRIETVVAQLENWHDKLLQGRSHSVSQRI